MNYPVQEPLPSSRPSPSAEDSVSISILSSSELHSNGGQSPAALDSSSWTWSQWWKQPLSLVSSVTGLLPSSFSLPSGVYLASYVVPTTFSFGYISRVPALLHYMQQHTQLPYVQESCCHSLWSLISVSDYLKQCIVQAGGIPSILRAMSTYPNEAELQVAACGCLRDLCWEHEENGVAIQQAGGIQLILTAMNTHPLAAQLQEQACYALCHLSFRHADHAQMITAAGGVRSIITAMNQHIHNAQVQAGGCNALFLITVAGPTAQNLIVEHGGVIRILTALKLHSSDVKLAQVAISALGDLAAQHPSNAITLTQAGVMLAILESMRFHLHQADVQDMACLSLVSLSCDVASNKSELIAAGGVMTILNAMNTHSSHASVSQRGCLLLMVLAEDNPVGQQAIADAGGILTITQVLYTHQTSPLALKHACLALACICSFHPNNQQLASAAGVLVALSSIMKPCTAPPSVQTAACEALRRACQGQASLFQSVLTLDGLSLILRSMHVYLHDSALQESAIRWLFAFALVKSVYRTHLMPVAALILPYVLSSLQMHPTDLDLQCNGCALLARLYSAYIKTGRHSPSHVLSMVTRCLVTIVIALNNHPTNVDLQLKFLFALTRIKRATSCHPSSLHSLRSLDGVLVNVGGLETLLNMMQTSMQNADVQAASAGILVGLALVPTHRRSMLSSHALLPALLESMQTHSTDRNVQEIASGIIWILYAPVENLEPWLYSHSTASVFRTYPPLVTESLLSFALKGLPSMHRSKASKKAMRMRALERFSRWCNDDDTVHALTLAQPDGMERLLAVCNKHSVVRPEIRVLVTILIRMLWKKQAMHRKCWRV